MKPNKQVYCIGLCFENHFLQSETYILKLRWSHQGKVIDQLQPLGPAGLVHFPEVCREGMAWLFQAVVGLVVCEIVKKHGLV